MENKLVQEHGLEFQDTVLKDNLTFTLINFLNGLVHLISFLEHSIFNFREYDKNLKLISKLYRACMVKQLVILYSSGEGYSLSVPAR